jgi:hypothetical protein
MLFGAMAEALDERPQLFQTPGWVKRKGQAGYLALKPWHIRDLIRLGVLARVTVPLGPDRRGRRADRRLRRVLVDVRDLDFLVDTWKNADEAVRRPE